VFTAQDVPSPYKEDNWDNEVSSVREAVKETDLSAEAEKSPLFEAVTGKRLVKTQQA
jgi:hypothetical protein